MQHPIEGSPHVHSRNRRASEREHHHAAPRGSALLGFVKDGRLIHRRGVTDSAGLYFIGLTWQHTRGSALLGFVKDDAEHIAREVGALRLRSV